MKKESSDQDRVISILTCFGSPQFGQTKKFNFINFQANRQVEIMDDICTAIIYFPIYEVKTFRHVQKHHGKILNILWKKKSFKVK